MFYQREGDPEMTVSLYVLLFDGHQHDLVPLVGGEGQFWHYPLPLGSINILTLASSIRGTKLPPFQVLSWSNVANISVLTRTSVSYLAGPLVLLNKDFFTPIPCTHSSLPLELIFFIFMDMQDHTICCVWIHFTPTSLYPRREETLGLSWKRTQVLLLLKRPL